MHDTALRIDKWLWYARFFKSRSLAAKHVQAGEIRVNRQRVSKASVVLKVGDVLTFALGDTIRVVEVAALGERLWSLIKEEAIVADRELVAHV